MSISLNFKLTRLEPRDSSPDQLNTVSEMAGTIATPQKTVFGVVFKGIKPTRRSNS